jgi:hypothetical protein
MLAFIDLESRVPSAHPLRVIKALTDQALDGLSDTFDEIYSESVVRRSRRSACSSRRS